MTKALEVWIKKCESLKFETYTDTTGHLTLGWGRNLENGIHLDEAELMFQNDLKKATQELAGCEWFVNQPSNVQNALINMNFNLGIHKLSGFKKMIAALERKDYTTAAIEALNSEWSKQVGQRAKDVALMMRQG